MESPLTLVYPFVLLSAICYQCPRYSTNKRLYGNRAATSADPMNKFGMILLLLFVIGLVVFATWQLFAGNLAASFATFPFLLITYLFVLGLRRKP